MVDMPLLDWEDVRWPDLVWAAVAWHIAGRVGAAVRLGLRARLGACLPGLPLAAA